MRKVILLSLILFGWASLPQAQGEAAGTSPPTVVIADSLGFTAECPTCQADSATRAAAGVVQHSFNHREQVVVGGIIMSCLILMLVTMNNYNPK